MSVLAAAALVTALVGLPAGTTAPPPGSVPHAAHVQVLDRQLGIVSISLPRASARRSLARLRAAPGVRYATVPALSSAGGLASSCTTFDFQKTIGAASTAWRSTIHLKTHSASGFTVGIADTGADLSRLGGTRDRLVAKNFTQRAGVSDASGHGTEVASLVGASRPDIHVSGVAPNVGLAIARIALPTACDTATLSRNLIAAFAWFRSIGDVQIVNVSANIPPSAALVESLHALQQTGTLVVAATGNKASPGKNTFPAGEPHVIGVGALGSGKTTVWSDSGRGAMVDLVAPGIGSGVILSLLVSQTNQTGNTANGTSFATPLVSGAAALVWAKHPSWDASRVASAIELSAKHLSGARPNSTSGYGRLNVQAALATTPPADLDEPNDWSSAARGLTPLAHKLSLGATVGGDDDPLDAYPVVTRGPSPVRVTGKGPLHVYLLRSTSLAAIDHGAKAVASAAAVGRTGTSVRIKVPRKGTWYVVVAPDRAVAPVGYTLRVG
jgi:subtilisin family serine protease